MSKPTNSDNLNKEPKPKHSKTAPKQGSPMDMFNKALQKVVSVPKKALKK